jgi:hypothetical protein
VVAEPLGPVATDPGGGAGDRVTGGAAASAPGGDRRAVSAGGPVPPRGGTRPASTAPTKISNPTSAHTASVRTF